VQVDHARAFWIDGFEALEPFVQVDGAKIQRAARASGEPGFDRESPHTRRDEQKELGALPVAVTVAEKLYERVLQCSCNRLRVSLPSSRDQIAQLRFDRSEYANAITIDYEFLGNAIESALNGRDGAEAQKDDETQIETELRTTR